MHLFLVLCCNIITFLSCSSKQQSVSLENKQDQDKNVDDIQERYEPRVGIESDVVEPSIPSQSTQSTELTMFTNITVLGESSFSGQKTNVMFQETTIVELGATDIENLQIQTRDLEGHWIVPAFIDSHVHFAYLPKSNEMLDGGIVAAVDLAAPEDFLNVDLSPLHLLQSGPMITSVQGYPTQSWGANGYGIQCATTECIESSIDRLHGQGASIIKIPLVEPLLPNELLVSGVERAHHLGLQVVSHAMNEAVVSLAAQVGVDVLAHCPTSQLSSETIDLWSNRVVISTLAAFGGSQIAIDNLSRLFQAGATILYGTDFGNSNQLGISSSEISLLKEAGLSSEEIILSGTSAPAEWWGLDKLGKIEEGYHASFLIYSENPLENPLILAQPMEVWIDGQQHFPN